MSGNSENTSGTNKKRPQSALNDETINFSMENITFAIDQPCSPIVTSKFSTPAEDNGIFTVTGNEIFKIADSKKASSSREMSTVEKIKRSFECGDCRALGTCKTCGPYGICMKCRNKMKSENDAQKQAAVNKEIVENKQEIRMIDALDLQKRSQIDQPNHSNQGSSKDKISSNQEIVVAEIECEDTQRNIVEEDEVTERVPIEHAENEREAIETQARAIEIENAIQEAVGFATIQPIKSEETQRNAIENDQNEQKSILDEETQRNPLEIDETQLDKSECEDSQVEGFGIIEPNRECEQIQQKTIEFEGVQQRTVEFEKLHQAATDREENIDRETVEFDGTERVASDDEKTQRKTVEFEEIAEKPVECERAQRKLMERRATGIRPEQLQRNQSTESIPLDRIDECENDSYDGKMSKDGEYYFSAFFYSVFHCLKFSKKIDLIFRILICFRLEMEKNVNNWLKLEPLELDSIKKKRRMTFEEAMEHISKIY